jgi:iron complex outermembrane recepter protein
MKGLQIEAGVRNSFDKDYELSEGYPMPGRTYFSNLTYRF